MSNLVAPTRIGTVTGFRMGLVIVELTDEEDGLTQLELPRGLERQLIRLTGRVFIDLRACVTSTQAGLAGQTLAIHWRALGLPDHNPPLHWALRTPAFRQYSPPTYDRPARR